MAEYTVQDTKTGKTVTFEWNDTQPPTDADMEEVFAQAKSFKPTPTESQGLSRKPLVFAEGANKGIANLLGMPVDLMNMVIGGYGGNKPVGGSEWMKEKILPPQTVKPEGFVENVLGATGEQIPYAMSGGLGTVGKGTSLLKTGLQLARPTVGAGIGVGTARTVAPDSPTLEMIGALTGSVTPLLTKPFMSWMQPKGKRLVESALKIPPRSVPKEIRDQAVDNIIKRDIPFSEKGLQKVTNLLDDVNKEIDTTIKAMPQTKTVKTVIPGKTVTETSPVVKPEGGNPVITRSEQPKPYSYDIEINPGGNVHIVGDMVSKQRIRDNVSQFFHEKQKELYGEPNIFWRFTNNPDEINLAKKGQLRKSIDHTSGSQEKGVSVSEHLGYSVAGYKHGYKVKGKVVGYGFDGEPLLDPSTIEVVGGMLHENGIRSARIKDIADFRKTLTKYGWTEEQYNKIADGKFDMKQQPPKDIITQLPDEVITNKIGTIDMTEVSKRIDDLKGFYEKLGPKLAEEFLKPLNRLQYRIASQGFITPVEAQEMKKTLYTLNRKHYGELKTAQVEGYKAVARGLKEELVRQNPELANLNKNSAELINLETLLEKSLNRVRNYDIIRLGDTIMAGVGGVVGGAPGAVAGGMFKGILEMPRFKVALGRALAKAKQKAITTPGARALIATGATQNYTGLQLPDDRR